MPGEHARIATFVLCDIGPGTDTSISYSKSLAAALEGCGAHATFFCDARRLLVDFGGHLGRLCGEFAARGHDVQLVAESESTPTGEKGVAILGDAAERIRDITGRRPMVHRGHADCFPAGRTADLVAAGLEADATVWPDPKRSVELPQDLRWRNTAFEHDGVLHIPVTHYVRTEAGPPSLHTFDLATDGVAAFEPLLDVLIPDYFETFTFVADAAAGQRGVPRDIARLLERATRHPNLDVTTLGEYVRLRRAGRVQQRTGGPVFPLPRYDGRNRVPLLDFVRRYDALRLVAMDQRFRELPAEEAPFTRPPDEVAEQLRRKAKGLML